MTSTTAPAVDLAAPPRQRRNLRAGQTRAAWLLVAPFLAVFTAFFIVPLIYSAYLSLFTSKMIGGQVFSGFANYGRALNDPSFWSSVGRVALFLAVQVPIMLGLAVFVALALDSLRVRGGKIVRILVFVPYAVPSVVATLMWGYIYGNKFGLITQIFDNLGLGSPNLLGREAILGSTMNIVCWEFIGYNMIVMYAALRTVPNEVYEAAEVDGASQIQVALRIKIPALRPALVLTGIFSIIGSFQLFNEPKLLYELAPNAIGSSFTPNLYAYNLAFSNLDTNYAAAIAFMLGFVIMAVSFTFQLVANRGGGGR
jgi:multiple sugar transport system permease protein